MAGGQDKAYSVLRKRVVGGHYSPGFQLREEPLAKELGLSRTPVRAALKKLVDDRLATADAGQGVRVSEWSEADIEETFRLRILLESHAAELAVVRGGEDMVERLDSSNRIMAAALARNGEDDIALIQETNREFHRTLINFAGSPRLRAILEPMIDMPIVVRSFFLYSPAELAQSLHHHEDIAIAARLRNGELGRHAMQLHLRMSYARVLRHREKWRKAGLENSMDRSS